MQTSEDKRIITGILGIILSLVWFAVVYDSPEKNPHLSEKEQTIFEREGSKIKIASADVVSFTRWNSQLKRACLFSFPFISFMTFVHQFSIQAKNIPWKSILTSLPVWALLLANVTRSWVFATMVMEIPQYFADVFGLNVATVWFFYLLEISVLHLEDFV